MRRTFPVAAVASLVVTGAVGAARAADTGVGLAPTGRSAGFFEVSVQRGEQWQVVGSLEFDKTLRRRALELPAGLPEPVTVRVTHAGPTAAHVDAVTLGVVPPRTVEGLGEPAAVAKLAAADLDVATATRRSFACSFPSSGSRVLAVTARVEAPRVAEFPFAFPLDNLYRPPASYASFYTYRLGSAPGRLTVDGELAGESLGAPLFREFSATGTGHPSADTWGWIRDDGETLYAAIDFLPDNTFDGDADYATLVARTPAGVKEFRVSVPERAWGTPGFTTTSRVGYQHKTYEFAIPLAELGVHGPGGAETLQLAFSAYGTAAPPQPVIDEFAEGAQTLAVATGTTVGGVGSCAPACTIIAGERDIQATETSGTGGTLEVSANAAVPGRLRVLSVGGGVGNAAIVWDGPDGNPASNALGLYVSIGDTFSMLEVAAANPGTSPVSVQLRVWTDTTGTSYFASPVFSVAAGAALDTIRVPWDSLTLTGSFGELWGVRAFDLQVSGAAPGFDLQVESVRLTTGTTLPLVVDNGEGTGTVEVYAPAPPPPPPPIEAGATGDGTMWGGERDVWVRLDSGTWAWIRRQGGFALDYYAEDGAGRIVWDGNDDDFTNLSFAGPTLDVSSFDLFELENLHGGPVTLHVVLYSAAGACSEATTAVNTGGLHTRLALPLGSFTQACAAPVDLAAIKAIVLEMANDAPTGFTFNTIGFGDGVIPVELQAFTVE